MYSNELSFVPIGSGWTAPADGDAEIVDSGMWRAFERTRICDAGTGKHPCIRRERIAAGCCLNRNRLPGYRFLNLVNICGDSEIFQDLFNISRCPMRKY